MNKPRITQGLTNLLNKYSTGPLAGAGNVPRGTPVQSFAPGGSVMSYDEYVKNREFEDMMNSVEAAENPSSYNYSLSSGGGEMNAGDTNFTDDYLRYMSSLNQSTSGAAPTPAAPLETVDVAASTGPVTPAYTDAPVAETVNFVDNPVTSVPVVAPVAPAPVAPAPVPPTPVAPTPVAPTPVVAAPVAVSEPIPNPVTYPTAAVDPVVAPIDDTPLPPSVYNPPAPPTESVYTPPAATVVDTPETLFTPPPPVFEVPEAQPYNYLQELRPNFDISDVIKTQTGGYTPTQGMVINPTQYQYPGAPEITGDNVYVPEIYQSLPSLELSTVDVEDLADTTGSTDTAGVDATQGAVATDQYQFNFNPANIRQGLGASTLSAAREYARVALAREQDYADKNGYTLGELRLINQERLASGLEPLGYDDAYYVYTPS